MFYYDYVQAYCGNLLLITFCLAGWYYIITVYLVKEIIKLPVLFIDLDDFLEKDCASNMFNP